MTETSIAIAATGRDWALGLHRFVADHGGARVRVRVMHPEQALEESYDVLVIDDVTSFLSAHFVQQVQKRDRKVLGVFDESAGEQRLRKLGVNAVMRADAEPEAFVAAIVNLAAQRNVDEEFAELIADLHSEEAAPGESTTARIVAVAGAGGGVGATEVAVAVAADLAPTRSSGVSGGCRRCCSNRRPASRPPAASEYPHRHGPPPTRGRPGGRCRPSTSRRVHRDAGPAKRARLERSSIR